MGEPAHETVQQWMTKAEHDLASAKRLGLGHQPILDTAAYHCQQAAEKALKAILAWKRTPPARPMTCVFSSMPQWKGCRNSNPSVRTRNC